MGMYDSVWVSCPKCDKGIEVQSKVGPCQLKNYYDEAPPGIAQNINGEEIYCEQCKSPYRVLALQNRMVHIVAIPLHICVDAYDVNHVFEKDRRH